jgi:peptidoglycan/LPS O-acetylase OafA/YrhL
MDTLAIGGLIATYAVGDFGVDALRGLSKALVAAGLGMLLLIWLVSGSLAWNNKFWLTAGFSFVGWFYGGVLVLAVSAPLSGLPHRALTLRPLLFLGKYSYGIYVIHGLLWPWFDVWFSTGKIRALVGSYFAALFLHLFFSTLVTVGLAFVSWHLFEKQFLKLKHLFEYRRGFPPPSQRKGHAMPRST